LKILVFGATGPTGQQVVTQAFSQGHIVTAFARKPESLPINDKRLRLVVGDTTQDRSAILDAIRGQDLVVSALGRRKTLKSDNLMTRSMRLIVPAMEQFGVRRFILMSAFGVGESHSDAPLIPRIMYRFLLSDIFADKKNAEDRVRQSTLDWTIVYPVLLTNGPLTGNYRVGERLALSGIPKISRADVAHFMLAEAEARTYVRKVPVISY
jgi:putative NADH-flavin reductase